jgi:DNA-binding beta-propeller fold protein YncE
MSPFGIRPALRIGFGLAACLCACLAQEPKTPPLRLVQMIALPGVEGRIDHMTVDVKRRRVILSALGSNTVEVVDVFAARRIRTITGLARPQGALYAPDLDKLFVANEASGQVHVYDGETYELQAKVDFGGNTDNLRYDAKARRVYVGYGEGAIGAIDAATNKRLPIDYKLDAHPEAFQLETNGTRIFVNVADGAYIAVIDRATGAIAKWPLGALRKNFPMALDEANQRLFIGTRIPSRLVVLNATNGKVASSLPAAGDMDDLMIDAQRKRLYIPGGEGFISVIQYSGADNYSVLAPAPSRAGARTSVFYVQRDRVYLAVPGTGDHMAALWVYEPQE